MTRQALLEYEIWFDGSHDASAQLPETPPIGSIVRTHAMFSYKVLQVEYLDNRKSIRLIADRWFR